MSERAVNIRAGADDTRRQNCTPRSVLQAISSCIQIDSLPSVCLAAAESLFGASIPAGANPWWLYLESSFLENSMGECVRD
jgi:hypothetical protein